MTVAKHGKAPRIATREMGDFFRRHRLEANVSETLAAEYLTCSIATLRDYESNEKALPLHLIYAYSNLLNLEPADVLKELLDRRPDA
ncbi:MAG: helix-turn-helix transcriptional regulator [Bdellovibrionota bacterium]